MSETIVSEHIMSVRNEHIITIGKIVFMVSPFMMSNKVNLTYSVVSGEIILHILLIEFCQYFWLLSS